MYNLNESEILKYKLSRIFDIVRNDVANKNNNLDLYVLSLVFLKRIADDNPDIKESWKHIRNNASYLDNQEYLIYELKKVFNTLYVEIDTYNLFFEINFKNYNFASSLYAIISYLDSLSLSSENISNYEMGVAFEYLIYKLQSYSSRVKPFTEEMTRFIVGLLDLHPNDTIYDPFCGPGNFLTEIVKTSKEKFSHSNNVSIHGQEINNKNYIICIMNLIMHGEYNASIVLGDTMLNPGNTDGYEITEFNKIITNIPSSIRNDNYYNMYIHDKYRMFKYGMPPRKSSNYAYIQYILSSLKKNGRAIVVVNNGLLSSEGHEKEIRKKMIENDLIEAIVSMPMRINSSSKISNSLLIFNKNKEHYKNKKILFVNGLWYSKVGNESHELHSNLDKITEIVKRYVELEGTSRIVSLEEIQERHFSLDVNRYDSVFLENESLLKQGLGRKLGDLVELVSDIFLRETEREEEGVPYIRIKDLNDSIKERYIKTEEIEKRKLLVNKKILSQPGIVVSLIGDKLKPTIYSSNYSDSQNVIVGQNLLALVPKNNLINFEYLYYQLYNPRVLNQVKMLKTGTIPRIKKKDFLNIVINIPDLKTQENYIKEQKSSLIEIESLRDFSIEKENELEKVAQNAQKEIISTLSHNALPYIFYIHSNLDTLKNFISSRGFLEEIVESSIQNTEDIDIELLISQTDNHIPDSIKNIFDRLEMYATTLEKYIDLTNKFIKLELKESDFKVVNLFEFLSDLVNMHEKEINNKYKLIIDCSKSIYVNIHEFSFRELFNQLFRNADMHAFINKNRKNKNVIKIKIVDHGEFINIIYTNNGEPFNLSKNDYTSPLKKGRESKGQGLGGAYINKVISAHSGKIEIIQREIGMELHLILPNKGDELG